MPKLFRFHPIIKRIAAFVLAAFILTFSVSLDYNEARYTTVYAGVAPALQAIIEAIMASMGLSFSNTNDLWSASQAMGEQMARDANDANSPFKKLQDALDVAVTAPVVIDYACFNGLKEFLYNFCSDKISKASDVATPVASASSSANVKVYNGSFTDSDILFDIPFKKATNGSYKLGLSTCPIVVSTMFNGCCYISFVQTKYKDKGFFVLNNCKVKDFNYGLTGTGYYQLYDYSLSNSMNAYMGYVEIDEGSWVIPSSCMSTSGSGGNYTYWFNGKATSTRYYDSSGKEYVAKNGNLPFGLTKGDAVSQTRVFINKGTKVYSSLADYSKLNGLIGYAPTSPVYGLNSAAKPYTQDASGNVTIPQTSSGITKAVEDAVAAAMADNPSITEEELNAAMAKVIASNAGISEDIDEQTTTLSKLINEVKAIASGNASVLDVMQVNIASIASSITSVQKTASANADALSDLKSKVSVWDDWAGSSSTTADSDTESAAKVWTPGAVSVPKIFQGALDFLANPLSQITKFLKEIKAEIVSLPVAMAAALVFPKAQDIADAMVTVFPKAQDIADALSNVLVFPKAKDIADALAGVISFPKAKDITDSMATVFPKAADIPKLISDAFVVDMDAIAPALAALESTWAKALPFSDKIAPLFDKFSFSDNYNYPVIKIQTPKVIKEYYKDNYIILLDFADYKTQLLWARNLVRAMLWFSFGISIVGHLRTNLHIG